MLLDPEVKVIGGGDNAISLQELVIRFMKTLKMTEQEVNELPDKMIQVYHKRRAILCKSGKRCEITNALMFEPEVDGRLINLQGKLNHLDA